MLLWVSAPAGWLVTQAVRLRAYLQFILLASATAVDVWALPSGLLEPFPADVLLSGVRGLQLVQRSHFHVGCCGGR